MASITLSKRAACFFSILNPALLSSAPNSSKFLSRPLRNPR